MKLQTYKEVKTRLPASKISSLFDMITRKEGATRWSSRVNLIVTIDRRLRALNREFRSKDRATDVLSFNIDPPDEPDGVFGEIYISDPYTRRQAEEYGVSVSTEYVRLFCHGLLHLFGYDHERQTEARRMEEKQEYFLRRLERGGGR